jgi:hypothetical protein
MQNCSAKREKTVNMCVRLDSIKAGLLLYALSSGNGARKTGKTGET